MIRSSSPSLSINGVTYIARGFLATMKAEEINNTVQSATMVRVILQASVHSDILPTDDPLKITLHLKGGLSAKNTARLFERQNIYPELVTHNQILFIRGLSPFQKPNQFKKAVKSVRDQLKN